MRCGASFIAPSASLLGLAVVVGGAGLALLWPAPSFALVGAAYLARRPALLGKRVDGALRCPAPIVSRSARRAH